MSTAERQPTHSVELLRSRFLLARERYGPLVDRAPISLTQDPATWPTAESVARMTERRKIRRARVSTIQPVSVEPECPCRQCAAIEFRYYPRERADGSQMLDRLCVACVRRRVAARRRNGAAGA